MEFALTDEQELLQETVRGFVSRECPPPRLRALFEAGSGHDTALWKGLAEMGIAGLAIPERHGGAGLELLDLALVAEELGAGALPVPFLGHALASLALVRGGSAEQRDHWLPRLASGEAVASIALAEPGTGFEPAGWRTRALAGRLHGRKRLAPQARHADLLVVGLAGGGLALVAGDAPGLSVVGEDGLDRTRPLAGLELDGAPAELLAGPQGLAEGVRDAGLVLLAADAFGAAWKLLRLTLDHTRERRQFGTPLAQFQAVKHQLADLATGLEPGRALWWFAAHAQDHLPEQASRAAAQAKAHVTDCAMRCARGALELHGGIGFTWECDVQFWFKRIMFDRQWLGGPGHHRERVARLAGWEAS